MPRLNVVERESAEGQARELLDAAHQKFGMVPNIFNGMANSPAALKAYLDMAETLSEGLLAPEDREAVYLAVSQSNRCAYCVGAHTAIAKNVGMSDEEIRGIRRFEPTNDKHRALVHFIRRVIETAGYVDDDDVTAVRDAGYSDGQIAESVAYIGLATYSNLFNHVNETVMDFPEAPEI